MQIHHFAEFGRISSGLFHDLANPITTLSLYVDMAKNQNDETRYEGMATSLNSINMAANRIKKLIESIKKQISNQEISEIFSLNREIKEAIHLLTLKAERNGIKLNFTAKEEIRITGNPIKFSQIITNLVANAIEAYPPAKTNDNNPARSVEIVLSISDKKICLTIRDRGIGIANDDIKKIFDPFYTTKENQEGLGIGLPLVKDMAEKDFNGQIRATSDTGNGTIFVFEFSPKL